MRQYTIKQRKHFYEKALEYLNSERQFVVGLCWVLAVVGARNSYFIDKYFPELWQQRPVKTDDIEYWWYQGDKAPRIEALKKAIILCDTELQIKST